MTLQFFVYGTLKPGERWFETYCEPYLIESYEAMAPGRIYHLPVGYPAMTLERGWVRGVWLTFADDRVLAPLDDLEGYDPNRPQDSEYWRIRHAVFAATGEPLTEAWLYVMPRDRVEALAGQWLPGGHWTGQNFPSQMS